MTGIWLAAVGAATTAAFALSAPAAHADGLLEGSTDALILGGTFMPDPAAVPGYMPAMDEIYLRPLGFADAGTLTSLFTPETPDFGPSIAVGELDLINAVEADYRAGDLSPTDPLTIVTYSQSTVIASLAEPILRDLGIPTEDLRFVMLGDATADPLSGATGILDTLGNTAFGRDMLELLGWPNLIDITTPSELYPTDVFTIPGDFFADYPVAAAELWVPGLLLHGEYPDLTAAVVQAALGDPAVDGLTTYFTLTPL